MFRAVAHMSEAEVMWAPESYLFRQRTIKTKSDEEEFWTHNPGQDFGDVENLVVGLLVSLPQDLEIYKPLVDRCVRRRLGFRLNLFVREGIATRYGLESLRRYSNGADLIVLEENIGQAVMALREISNLSCLISSSESSVLAHAYAHEVFLGLSEPIVKITLQHGWECLGFTQHYEQVESFRGNVRSAADVVCPWSAEPRATLSFADGNQKVVAIGVCKFTFESGMWPGRPIIADTHGVPRVLIADNRMSPRFTGTTEMRHWDIFASDVSSDKRLSVSHRFHQRDATLGIDHVTSLSLRGCSYVVSPPSTILIDALSEGCIPIGFSTGAIPRNLENFGPIHFVSTHAELSELISELDHETYYGELCRWLFANVWTIRGADSLIRLIQRLNINYCSFEK